MSFILILAIVLPVLLGAAFLLGRYMHDRQPREMGLSPVTRQHIELYQGGQLSESAIESAKRRFRFLLERGEVERVEAALRPGTQYVIHVRALAEIGGEDACRILERQLERRAHERIDRGHDPLERAWYRIDLAHHLRGLGRDESLPLLLECVADSDGESFPLVHYFAAETVCFPGFAGHARASDGATGRAALRALHFALEGLRLGVPPHVFAEGRLGELLEAIWDEQVGGASHQDPLVVRLFVEARRLLRRADDARRILGEDALELEAFDLQLSPLQALEPAFEEFLKEAGPALVRTLRESQPTGVELLDLLLALDDLRVDAAIAILPLLKGDGAKEALEPRATDAAVHVLRWSRDPAVGRLLIERACRAIGPAQRSLKDKRPRPPRRPSVPAWFPYRAVLFTLRQHGSQETEQFLLLAAHDWDPSYRALAVSSLGWWEPWRRVEVLLHLQEARFDPSPDVRHAARGALARLGERHALQWFRQALSSCNPQRVQEAVLAVAVEGLTLLWPDLDRLADADDSDIAFSAREALEQMREELDWRTGG